MEKWIMSIVGVVILTALFELFMVEGETKKYIKGILSVIVIIVIISPLPNLLKKDYSADVFNQEIYDERVYKKDDGFLYRLARAKYDEAETSLVHVLKEKGLDNVEITINIHLNGDIVEISNIVVSIENAVISENLKNININEMICDTVAQAVQIPRHKVIIYGEIY